MTAPNSTAGIFPLDKAGLLKAYKTMRTIREFEERLHADFAKGDIPGFVHLYAGEEAAGTGIMMHLEDKDRIASTHRGHGHCIAKGVDPKEMMAEIYGKVTGSCRGKGGSMHIADLSKGMMGANGILGAGAPLVCGAALAAKYRGDGAVASALSVMVLRTRAPSWRASTSPPCGTCRPSSWWRTTAMRNSTSRDYAVAVDSYVDRAAGFGLPGRDGRWPRLLRRV